MRLVFQRDLSVRYTKNHRANGMTLIELIVGLAIASLMTITGWRAIESLQSARDQTVNDAARWQALDTFFASLESDLRRAELTSFSGSATTLTLRIPGETPTAVPTNVRYVISSNAGSSVFNVSREVDSSTLTFTQVRGGSFEYRATTAGAVAGASATPDTFVDTLSSYPRAVQITLAMIDNNNANDPDVKPSVVKRLMVLR
jgi:prepilin-type N-terminal cleavage/methylation domain-containing protein